MGLDLSVAVNLSTRSLLDPHLVTTVMSLLDRWKVPAHRLAFELTESALMSDPARGQEVLTELHEMGVRISIDDFGTGYSSLAYLRQLPVDEIKIDKSFVQEMAVQDGDIFIVRSVADLGHSLGMEVVAEGVEDQHCLYLLTVMGCDQVQGYHLSRPPPSPDLAAWMQTSHALLAT
jgi:EAL domain-containing protein (putative c-di-GMP-specific phosphodiesterase class I)